jgi:transposase, IS5 family
VRIPFDPQLRLGSNSVLDVQLNTNCRDEIIPILAALQHIYGQPALRDEILKVVQQDVNANSNPQRGRTGMHYWPILVLAAVRLGCNLDYDKLQNLAEEHRSLRNIMGIAGWDDQQSFDWRCIRDNICSLLPETIERINHMIVAEGHRLVPEAAKTVRGDSFVVKANIHYPTDSSLIDDGLRLIVPVAVQLASLLGVDGWRQSKHLLRAVKKQLRVINRIAASKGRDCQNRLKDAYRTLIDLADRIVERAIKLLDPAFITICPDDNTSDVNTLRDKLFNQLNMTIQVCDVAWRRVIQGETIANGEKLFSLYEPETQLIMRGKSPNPIEFGHRILVIEDAAGFVCHYTVMQRGAIDSEVLVGEMKQLQERMKGRIRAASL